MSGMLEDRTESRRQEDTGGQVAVRGPQRKPGRNLEAERCSLVQFPCLTQLVFVYDQGRLPGGDSAHSSNKTHRLMCWRELLSEITRPFILFLKLTKTSPGVFLWR